MGRNLLIVRVDTTEPGLYGLGCGTFTQRFHPVRSMLLDHIKPLVIGRDATLIEELWWLMNYNGYWRYGPVTNNAIAAVDMALWDIKGKMAGMPLCDLLGGPVRKGAAVYQHADGRDLSELTDHVAAQIEQGMRHVRVRFGGGSAETRQSGEAGGMAYGGAGGALAHRPKGALDGAYYDPRQYVESTVEAIEHVRAYFGGELELLHDVHGRLSPAEAIAFAKRLEPSRLFFLEDALGHEDLDWYRHMRAATTTPQAVGELFNSPQQWLPLVQERLIDFIRIHISQIGGLTPARKVAHVAEAFGVRTAWHGPGDLSPIGHALHLHLNLVSTNFGLQELQPFTEETREVFPGSPTFESGYLYPNDQPGIGVGLDEALAERYPCDDSVIQWTQARLPDGSLHRP
ncbi:MAG: enolase C-terminal domain-like protein [Planctomycetota bacterium]